MTTVKPYTAQRYAIVGPYGNIWTHHTFHTAEEAMNHVKKFWAGRRQSVTGYRAVPVAVTIAPLDAEEKA